VQSGGKSGTFCILCMCLYLYTYLYYFPSCMNASNVCLWAYVFKKNVCRSPLALQSNLLLFSSKRIIIECYLYILLLFVPFIEFDVDEELDGLRNVLH
jgi:hypothetical protein